MSFSFSFSGEDYSSEDDEARSTTEEHLSNSTSTLHISAPSESCADDTNPAKLHTLESLLSWLPESIAYSFIQVSPETQVAKREVWDVKHQLMSGFSPSEQPAEQDDEQVLEYLGKDDLITGLYEGGFKTWECAIDLSRLLSTHHLDTLVGTSGDPERFNVVELGCGSAIPTATLLSRLFQAPSQEDEHNKEKVTLVVQDYNVSVLRYLTIPNLFLAWYIASIFPFRGSGPSDTEEPETEEEVWITDDLKSQFLDALASHNITIHCISGSWSSAMAALITGGIGNVDLLLASETIYSPTSLPAFCTLLKDTLKVGRGTALVAAKKVYFGVGGGVEEFTRKTKALGMAVTEDQTSDKNKQSAGGVQRTILSVRHN